MNNDKRYKQCSSCGSREGLLIKKSYDYCCICGFRKFKVIENGIKKRTSKR